MMNTQFTASESTKRHFATNWPRVALCAQCMAVRVDEAGDKCRQCVILIANREQLAAAQDAARTRAFWILVTFGFFVIAAAWFVWEK